MSSNARELRRACQAATEKIANDHGAELVVTIAMRGPELFSGAWVPDVEVMIIFLESFVERLKASKGVEIVDLRKS